MPLPITTPTRSGSGTLPSRPAWVTAWLRRGEGELGEQIVPSGFLPVHVPERVETLDLAGEADGKLLADRTW